MLTPTTTKTDGDSDGRRPSHHGVDDRPEPYVAAGDAGAWGGTMIMLSDGVMSDRHRSVVGDDRRVSRPDELEMYPPPHPLLPVTPHLLSLSFARLIPCRGFTTDAMRGTLRISPPPPAGFISLYAPHVSNLPGEPCLAGTAAAVHATNGGPAKRTGARTNAAVDAAAPAVGDVPARHAGDAWCGRRRRRCWRFRCGLGGIEQLRKP